VARIKVHTGHCESGPTTDLIIRIADDARAEWIASREEKAATVAAMRRKRHREHDVAGTT